MEKFNLDIGYLRKYYSNETINNLKLVANLRKSVFNLDSSISFDGIPGFTDLVRFNLMHRSKMVLKKSKLIDNRRLFHKPGCIYYKSENGSDISLLNINISDVYQKNTVLLHGYPRSKEEIRKEKIALEAKKFGIYFDQAIDYACGEIDYSDDKMQQYIILRTRLKCLNEEFDFISGKKDEEERITLLSSKVLLNDWKLDLKRCSNGQYEKDHYWTKVIRK